MAGFLLSCAGNLNEIPKYTSVSAISFTKYTENGFLITSEPYLEEYQSIGMINVEFRVPATREKIEKNEKDSEESYTKYYWDVDELSNYQEEIIDLAYDAAIKMGANAIMNFKIKPSEKTYQNGTEIVTIPGVQIYGFAIKRK